MDQDVLAFFRSFSNEAHRPSDEQLLWLLWCIQERKVDINLTIPIFKTLLVFFLSEICYWDSSHFDAILQILPRLITPVTVNKVGIGRSDRPLNLSMVALRQLVLSGQYTKATRMEGIVRLLLERGARVCFGGHLGRTPIFDCVVPCVLSLLIQKGAEVTILDDNGELPLEVFAGYLDQRWESEARAVEYFRHMLLSGFRIGTTTTRIRELLEENYNISDGLRERFEQELERFELKTLHKNYF